MKKLNHLIIQLTQQLKSKHLTITTAESCTGGLIASYLTEFPGSSVWFERGFVTYSNQSKTELLSVAPELIKEQGAVSEAVAKAMAVGALSHSNADVSIAVTGIAGPDGGSLEKPVGTVWFAFATTDVVQSKLCQFGPLTREEIRRLACEQALLGTLSIIAS